MAVIASGPVPYITSPITIVGYYATSTGFKIKWNVGDDLAAYKNNTSSIQFTVNGVSRLPVITYDGTNIFASFSGLTNVDWTVVLTSTLGTHATSSIIIPQAPASINAGGTTYVSNSSPSLGGWDGAKQKAYGTTFTTNCPITSSFSRLYCAFSCNVGNDPVGHCEIMNILETLYNQYNWGIDIFTSDGSLNIQINQFPQNANTPNMGDRIIFDPTNGIFNGVSHSFKILFTPTSISAQIDSGIVQTIGPIGIKFWAGTDYNFIGAYLGANFGWSGANTFTNLLITN